MTAASPKPRRGRTTKRPIPDTPENIMRAIVNTPPKTDDEWRYLQDGDGDG